jgi:U3 small nucleolar RNA-associated protein 15
MSAPAPKFQKKLPALSAAVTSEQKLWQGFKSQTIIKETTSVVHVHIPEAFLASSIIVTSSTQVNIYDTLDGSTVPRKSISRFKDVAYSGEIRKDVKVLVASDKSGNIQVFDLASRAVLRHWLPENAHNALPIHVVKFDPNNLTQILSCGDDKCVKLWSIAYEQPIATFRGFKDYVRTAEFIPETNQIVSGSLNGEIKVWNIEEPCTPVTEILHGTGTSGVLNALLPLPGGLLLASAGGEGILRIWDLVSRRCLYTFRNHQKDITTLTINSEGTRLLFGALDGHIKIYDIGTWKLVHGIRYTSPILCMAISMDSRVLAVGMVGGFLSIRTRDRRKRSATDNLDERMLESSINTGKKQNVVQRFRRGTNYRGDDAQIIIEQEKKRRIAPYEKDFRQYHYKKALDRALTAKLFGPVTVYTVLKELQHRSGLIRALEGRDEASLELLFKFLSRYIHDARFSYVIIIALSLVLELYFLEIFANVRLRQLFNKLVHIIDHEIGRTSEIFRLIGEIELLISNK